MQMEEHKDYKIRFKNCFQVHRRFWVHFVFCVKIVCVFNANILRNLKMNRLIYSKTGQSTNKQVNMVLIYTPFILAHKLKWFF